MNKKILTISLIILGLILGGVYLWNNKYDQKIVNQEQEEIINDEVDTGDWETFRDEELGIEFKYPGDWEYNLRDSKFIELKDSKSEYYYEGDPIYLIGVAISELPNDFSFDNWIERLTQVKEKRGGYVKNIQIGDQINATESFDYLSHDTTIYFNDNKYTITKVHIDSIDTEDIYQAILDSLRFIE